MTSVRAGLDNPDIHIRQGDDVYAPDTKGSPLPPGARRKRTNLDPGSSGRPLLVRIIDRSGYTVWAFRGDGRPHWPHPTRSLAR